MNNTAQRGAENHRREAGIQCCREGKTDFAGNDASGVSKINAVSRFSGQDASEYTEACAPVVHNRIPVIALVGPTASGKTALSIELAYALGGKDAVEIVSADAMQLYRGMDIGTAKASMKERRGIVHHQIDVLDISDEASVAVYQEKARRDIADIMERGKIPLLVGGSGLYVSAVLDRLDFPGADPSIRAELEAIASGEGLAPLVEELREKDPRSAAVIDIANPRRIIRALEVVRLTGRSYTPVFPRHTSYYENVYEYGLLAPREWLDPRIQIRTEHMFEGGLLEETHKLICCGLRESPTAAKATGYAQALAVLEGAMTREEAIESTASATRHLAKKQRTWFKADKRVRWIDASNVAFNGGDDAFNGGDDALCRAAEAITQDIADQRSHDQAGEGMGDGR